MKANFKLLIIFSRAIGASYRYIYGEHHRQLRSLGKLLLLSFSMDGGAAWVTNFFQIGQHCVLREVLAFNSNCQKAVSRGELTTQIQLKLPKHCS
ncbi:hypothetical protein [Lederbergia galactosidilytica]|uniref:hypothetical protein n=1 Tax=Lederbergia galactosidilytica TaxID=217031 RepID=UPI001AE530D8|nr:hypothetical protein [Lederbergia galactosidilytica]